MLHLNVNVGLLLMGVCILQQLTSRRSSLSISHLQVNVGGIKPGMPFEGARSGSQI